MMFSSGTALAGPQAGVAPQEAFTRLDGAAIVTSSLCVTNDSEFTVWGSGWGSGEVILLSVVTSEDKSFIWYSGSVNEAGAFELVMGVVTKPPVDFSTKVKYPGAGLFTLEALGMSGRLATAPALFVASACPGTSPFDNYPLPAS